MLTQDVESRINNGSFDVVDAGPLHHPISSFELKVNDDNKIELTTHSEENSQSEATVYLAGTVRINNDNVLMKSIGGTTVSLNGVRTHQARTFTDEKTGKRLRVEKSMIHEVKCNVKDSNENDFLIEYIKNIDENFLWPDSVVTEVVKEKNISFGNGEERFNLKEKNTSKILGNALRLKIEDMDIYLAIVDSEEGRNTAVIIYRNVVAENIRRKVRDCLSFCFGREILYLGFSVYNSDFNNVEFLAKSIYSEVTIDSYPTLIPAPLGQYENELGGEQTNHLVNALYENYENYENYDLQHVLGAYCHALYAPIHIAAVHFGAAIEAFQASYIKHHGRKFNSALMEKKEWTKFRTKTMEIVGTLNINDDEKQTLTNKISNLNQLSQSLMTKRFFSQSGIGIELNELELNAWQERNNAAHGNKINEGDFTSLIKNIRILKCIFHRIILSAVKGSEHYFDYYTIGYPIRFLKSPIPEEKA